MDNFLVGFYSIFGIVFVLVLAYFTSRWFATKSIGMTQGKYIKVIDRIILGKEKTILIIQVGNNYFLLGESSQEFTPISSLDQADLIPLERKGTQIDFQGIMHKYLTKKPKENNKLEKMDSLQQLKDRMNNNRFNKEREEK